MPGPLLAKGAKQDQLHNHNLLELGQSRSPGVQTSSQRFKGGKWGGTQICARVVGDVFIFLSHSTVVFGYDNGSGLYQYLLLPSSTKLAQQPSVMLHTSQAGRELDCHQVRGNTRRAGTASGFTDPNSYRYSKCCDTALSALVEVSLCRGSSGLGPHLCNKLFKRETN